MYERKDREEREAREALANIKTILAERDTLIRQRAADLEALNAVQKLHAQAVAERDEARRQVEAMRDALTRIHDASMRERHAQSKREWSHVERNDR